MTRTWKTVFILSLFLIALIVSCVWYGLRLFSMPYRNYLEEKKLITIESGNSVDRIARTLQKEGVVRYSWLLKGLFIWNKTQTQSKAGDYVFERAMTPLEVYEKLMKGEMQYTVFQVVEGANIFDVERIFESHGLCTADEFRTVTQSPRVLEILSHVDPNPVGLEGFLFPETYFLTQRELTAESVIAVMLEQFEKEFGEKERARALELRMSVREIVTLASLIEKETGLAAERPLISGVFHNRLKRSMLLQCDPTVIYAMLLNETYNGQILKKDLQFDSPYNTYVYGGLPPGPICNPGKASIEAALYPQETDKLYFVSRNDGSHEFSSNLRDHNRAVQKYQRNQRRAGTSR